MYNAYSSFFKQIVGSFVSKEAALIFNLQKENDSLDDTIEAHIEPIRQEIEELRKYVLESNSDTNKHMDLILSSYRFRLTQLCKAYIQQGFMTNAEYEQFVEFYKVYTGLGGNGQAKTYYERAVQLPVHDIQE